MKKKLFLAIVLFLFGWGIFMLFRNPDQNPDAFRLRVDQNITTSNLFAPTNVRITSVSDTVAEISWDFDHKEIVSEGSQPSEYAKLSGFRIYRDGYWYRDIAIGRTSFLDKGLLPATAYSYTISALTFDNKIEGEKSKVAVFNSANYKPRVAKISLDNLSGMLIDGDSITAGQKALEGRGWANQLRERLQSKYGGLKFTNNAVSGSLANDVRTRVAAYYDESSNSAELRSYGLYVFAVGINDLYGESKANGNESLYDYKETIKKIVADVSKYAQNGIVLVGITFYKDCCANSLSKVEAWNRGLQEIALEEKLVYVDVFSEMKPRADEVMEDILHPNQLGHDLIANKVWEQINQSVSQEQ